MLVYGDPKMKTDVLAYALPQTEPKTKVRWQCTVFLGSDLSEQE